MINLYIKKKNMAGAAFNPITLQNHNTDQGRQLAQRDNEMKDRALQRSLNMRRAGTSGFNPITGAPYVLSWAPFTFITLLLKLRSRHASWWSCIALAHTISELLEDERHYLDALQKKKQHDLKQQEV